MRITRNVFRTPTSREWLVHAGARVWLTSRKLERSCRSALLSLSELWLCVSRPPLSIRQITACLRRWYRGNLLQGNQCCFCLFLSTSSPPMQSPVSLLLWFESNLNSQATGRSVNRASWQRRTNGIEPVPETALLPPVWTDLLCILWFSLKANGAACVHVGYCKPRQSNIRHFYIKKVTHKCLQFFEMKLKFQEISVCRMVHNFK